MKQGLFNHETLTVIFGGIHSKPHNIFECKAIKVPKYKYKLKERESLGNGWYGQMETNEYEEDNLYIIIKDNICIGQMNPYTQIHGNIKSTLYPCNQQSLELCKSLNIEYNEKQTN